MKSKAKVSFLRFLEYARTADIKKLLGSESSKASTPVDGAVEEFKKEANAYLEKEYLLAKSFETVAYRYSGQERNRVLEFSEGMTDMNLKKFCESKAKEDVMLFMPTDISRMDQAIAMMAYYEKCLWESGENGDDEGRGLTLVSTYLSELKEVFVKQMMKEYPTLIREQEVRGEGS